MYPFIALGPIALPTKALVYIIGIWLSLIALEKTAARLQQNRETLYALATNALFVGLIGARLVFVVLHWPAYAANLFSIFWPLTVGYNIGGGLLAGGAYLFFMMRAKQLDYGQTADTSTPSLLIILFALFLADYLGGPGYGSATPWPLLPFHPVQLYEIVVILVGGAIWWFVNQKRPFAGGVFLATTAGIAFGLLLTTPFRGNTWITPNGWYVTQIIYLLITLVCLFTIIYYIEYD